MPRKLGSDSRAHNLTRYVLRAIRGRRSDREGSGTWEAAVRLSRLRSTFSDVAAFDAAVCRMVDRGLILADGVEPPALTLEGVRELSRLYPYVRGRGWVQSALQRLKVAS